MLLAAMAAAVAGGGHPAFAATAAGHPEAVTPIVVTPGDNQAAVSWSSDAGSGALSYTVTTDNGGGQCTVDDPVTTCPVTGLVPGTTYVATVTSYDAVGGAGGSGSVVDTATSAAFTVLPGAPTAVSATSGNGTIDVSWNAPGTGTAGIDHYLATTSPAGGSCTTTDNTRAACTIDTGLTAGVAYTVSVVSVGVSPSGNSLPGTTLPVVPGPPDAPTGVLAIAGNAQATVSWNAPGGFAAVAYYTVTSTPGGKVCNTPSERYTGCTVTGLTNLTSYTFTVVAHGVGGTGDSDPSTASAAVIPLPAAINLKATVNGKFVTAPNAGDASLIANRSTAGAWEKFDVVENGDGTISLQADVNGKYVSAALFGLAPLIANHTRIGSWEKFWFVDNGDGTISLRAMANEKYVSADNAGASPLIANRATVGSWERFAVTAAA